MKIIKTLKLYVLLVFFINFYLMNKMCYHKNEKLPHVYDKVVFLRVAQSKKNQMTFSR